MKSLYARLAADWDRLFPPDALRESFLEKLLSPLNGLNVIEVGCGSGATALFLASAGCAVEASDLDQAMVDVAQASAQKKDLLYAPDQGQPGPGTVRFSVQDMLAGLNPPPGDGADAVLCLGNTLPHLSGQDETLVFFRRAAAALKPGGTIVVQILNYPRIRDLGGLVLPELRSGNLIFKRSQTFNSRKGRILFETEVSDGDTRETRSHELFPLSTADLTVAANQAGLTPQGVFGDWSETPFGTDSPWLAQVFRKS